MQVKPWGTSVPACSLFVLDCHAIRIDGATEKVSTQWSTFDRTTTSGLVIRHCPRLVNLTNGELPVGLQANDFPKSLMDIEFCVTNLRILLDDLDLKWPKFGTIYFESCNLSTVPASLVRLSPYVTSLALNPISSIPESLLTSTAGYVHVGGTLITELPQTVNVSPFFKLRVDRTNISFFWDWIDSMVANAGQIYNSLPTILATDSPYCSELQRIFEEKQSNFSIPWHQGQSMTLSNASPENWVTLKKAVSCEAWTQTLYPVEFEDKYSKIKAELV
ncbi:hypothetical protein JG688_00006292 [Phytophthora aleatoria]|uniref:Uncharacterized protein n=1 Tax=Phytophthora aleatoria TaxID=2496075 RepID=A0A8J5M8Z1_9STRA|nr:hypothetical protein JG688_00006292 [Phytophthora aleatoria]